MEFVLLWWSTLPQNLAFRHTYLHGDCTSAVHLSESLTISHTFESVTNLFAIFLHFLMIQAKDHQEMPKIEKKFQLSKVQLIVKLSDRPTLEVHVHGV